MTSAHDTSGNGAGLPRVPSIPLSDETSGAANGQSIGSLVKDATQHLSTLIRAEIELARSEVAKEVKKGLTGSLFFIVALAIFLPFIPFGLITLALGLNDIFEWESHPWLGFLCVFGLILLLTGLFAFMGFRKVRSVRAPQRTIDSMRDTAAALTRRDGADNAPVPASGDALRRA